MRIRRSTTPHIAAFAITCLLSAAGANAQDTSATQTQAASSDAATTAAASRFNLQPGDQMLYSTTGKFHVTGMGQNQNEPLDAKTSVTVLEQKGDKLTLFASMVKSEQTSAGATQTPGPRYTFQMPVKGAEGLDEFEKEGLSGSLAPTFTVEYLFTPPAEGKTTVSTAMPVVNAVIDGEAEAKTEGQNTVTKASFTKGNQAFLERETVYSGDKHLNEAINTSMTLLVSRQGAQMELAIEDHTKLVSTNKLSPEELEKLKSDIAAAQPVIQKMQGFSMESPESGKAIVEGLKQYRAERPNGEFALAFEQLQKDLEDALTRAINQDKIKVGAEAPDFNATTIDNKPIKLSDYKGKVVLIDFWATWCGPCLMELPNVKKVYEENKDKGFTVIGISADETVEDLQKVVEQENIQWPQVFDKDQGTSSVQALYGVMKYPTTVLVDKEGKINAVDVRGEDLGPAVQKLVAPAK